MPSDLKLDCEMENCFFNANESGQKSRIPSSLIVKSFSSSCLNSSRDLRAQFLSKFTEMQSDYWSNNEFDFLRTRFSNRGNSANPPHDLDLNADSLNFLKNTLGKLVISGLSNLDQGPYFNHGFTSSDSGIERGIFVPPVSQMHGSVIQKLEIPCDDLNAYLKTTSKTPDHCHTRVIVHQLADAEEHFSKALSNLHVKSWKSVSDGSISDNEKSLIDSPEIAQQNPFPSTKTGTKRTVTDTFQNIADLAVEKHFEKSLANFRNKSPPSGSPLDLSGGGGGFGCEELFPCATGNMVQTSPSLMHRRSTFPSELFMLNPELSNNSTPQSGTFNPKKNWLALYGRGKQKSEGSDSIFSTIRYENLHKSLPIRDPFSETGATEDHVKDSRRTHRGSQQEASVSSRTRNKSSCCLTFELEFSKMCREECYGTRLTRSFSSPPSTFRAVSKNQFEKFPMQMPEIGPHTTTRRPALTKWKISSFQLNERTPRHYCEKSDPAIRARGFEVASLTGCQDIFERQSYRGVLGRSAKHETPTSSPTDTSGFFSDSTYSVDSKSKGIFGIFGSTDSCPTSPVYSIGGSNSNHILKNLRSTQFPQHCRSFGDDGDNDLLCEISNKNYYPTHCMVRKRAASDTGNLHSHKRSRSVAVDTPVDLRTPIQMKPVKFSRHQ